MQASYSLDWCVGARRVACACRRIRPDCPGLRAGLSLDPDQFYIGGHIETAPLVERLVFRPNVEVGFGDDVTLVAFNFEFVWKFPRRRSEWGFYAGGGPALNLYQFDGPGDETEGGFNFVGGLENRRLVLRVQARRRRQPRLQVRSWVHVPLGARLSNAERAPSQEHVQITRTRSQPSCAC